VEQGVDWLEDGGVLDKCVVPQVAQDKHQKDHIYDEEYDFTNELVASLGPKNSVHILISWKI